MADRNLPSSISPRRRPWFPALAILLAGLGAAGGWWWESSRSTPAKSAAGDTIEARLAAAGIDGRERAAIEGLVRDYILAHPEILPEAMSRLQANGAARQIAAQRDRIETPFAGAVLGNPRGTITLVQFTDYACTYCRQSVADISALTAAHPDLRVVVRELPILSRASEQAARMALSAARQGHYAAYHDAMFAGEKPAAASIAAAARKAGIDAGAAAPVAASAEVTNELAGNIALAKELGIAGTPAWVIGDRLLIGAVGRRALESAIAETRKAS
ncbi:DsbA family protein [Novosphingobium sp. Gsoil 351]|uniref:DsbA family protein n=1 Tax=Novosphingobium sp. Gsoil 351 TaxID=2675225 RepID=UPI0012B45E3F|nr:DsbA family protein [Novosphingobium sp. Gsoil 351]QGN55118.1 thioredoxin domain-containing protein [Novosphingobium sp. Gsoil 351]